MPEHRQYMVGDEYVSCDWRGPFAQGPIWWMSSKEGNRWYDDGPLTEAGRQLILEHFGLSGDDLPLAVLAETSPAKLAEMRRAFEEQSGISSRMDIRCQRVGGGHIRAEECC